MRSCGILCHPTSIPSHFGIGDLGAGAYGLLDFLAEAGQGWWQVLPLGPTGYGDSPYQPFSAFAGNPLLIDPEPLRQEDLLDDDDLSPVPPFPSDRVPYGDVITYKNDITRRAYYRLCQRSKHSYHEEIAAFSVNNACWLEDYVLFMALKMHHDWAGWSTWDRDIALRRPEALEGWRRRLEEELGYRRFLQFLFDRQWRACKLYANDMGIEILGDMPIFVGHDSADVWANQDLFQLDDNGASTVVAGVPPDYFSPTGQLWGNPLYRWDIMKERGYAWWLARFRRALDQVDCVRIDHFRGIAGYWQIPAGEETALNGHWVLGPGDAFVDALREGLGGGLPIIAEDLGLISEDVVELRERHGLAGMRVLQFGFGSDAANDNLPHNWPRNTCAYTATHDNDTTRGWYESLDRDMQRRVHTYCGSDGDDIHWTMIRMAYTSQAEMAIVPLQDILGLGSEARLNQPGNPMGNWSWRYQDYQLRPQLAAALKEMATLSGRCGDPAVRGAPNVHVDINYAKS